MDTKLALSKQANFAASIDALKADIAAIEPILKEFPKLEYLKPAGPQVYELKLKPIGGMGVSHSVEYAATYTVSADQMSIQFEPKKGFGNALLSGSFRFEDKGNGQVTAHIDIKGELNDISVPMLLRAAAPGFIKQMFDSIIGRYLEKLQAKHA